MWSNILSIYGRARNVFGASVPGLLFAIFALVHVAIWWAGPKLEIDGEFPLASVMSRLLCSVIISLLALSLWGIYQWRKLKNVNAKQQHEQLLEQNPTQGFIERQEYELNKIVSRLKQSLNCRNYLYELPWYLVLGLENAGKTSLINRSGQSFVLSSVMRASGERSENPYSFDWWIGDNAVLIDPDGELLAQKSTQQGDTEGLERSLWLHFIQWIEKKRSRRPLNGVVIALDIAHIASSDATERRAYANLIRARLRELMESLSTRLPVYITLTKLDMLHGFEPFFREYSKEERDEVLGFTFSLDSVNEFDSWLQEFDAQYDTFLGRFNALVPATMMQCRTTDERAAVYSLGRQLAGLKRILLQFFHDSFSSDQFSTTALIRGVYFTSVFQQGVPVNAFVDAAAARYGMAQSINSAQKANNSTTFFTPNLFKKIIYPEAGLAGDNFRVAKQKRRLMLLSVVACSIAAAMIVPAWHSYYQSNIDSAQSVLNKVTQYEHQKSEFGSDPTGKNLIEPLNLVRSATLEFGVFREKPKYISDLGLYQGHVIGPKVEQTYLSLLAYRYLPSLMLGVAKDMAQAPQGSDEKLALLRILRMLTDASGRDDKIVQDYFARYWQTQFTGNRELQEQLMSHLSYALEHTDLQQARLHKVAEAEAVLVPFDGMIAAAQTELRQIPIEHRLFRSLEQNAAAELGAPLDLRMTVGPVFDLVYQIPDGNKQIEIDRLMTREGFERYFVPRAEEISKLALIDTWVLGLRENIDFSAADKRVLQDKVQNLYQQAYVSKWNHALADIRIQSFKDIDHAVLVLSQLVNTSQPMTRLLQTLSQHTLLFPSLPEEEVARAKLMQSAQYRVAADIADDFNKINGLLTQQGENPAYIDEVTLSIRNLHDYLKAIQISPEQGRAALDATKKRIELSDVDPIYALQRVADGLPAPLNQTVQQMADDAWRVMLIAANRHLEVMWYEDVYLEFEQKLAGRYPFNPRAKKDVPLEDFSNFFAPDGTLDKFYQDKMRIFLQDPEMMQVGDEDMQVNIRQDVLAKVAMGKKIQQAFFNKKGSLDIEFSVEPLELSADKRRSIFNVDGQYVEYSHGPRMQTGLVWPNTLRPTAASKVTLVPGQVNRSPRSLTAVGPWALFRLLDRGQVTGSTASSVDYEFKVDRGHMRYRLQAEKTINPFTSSLLAQFNVPQTLY